MIRRVRKATVTYISSYGQQVDATYEVSADLEVSIQPGQPGYFELTLKGPSEDLTIERCTRFRLSVPEVIKE